MYLGDAAEIRLTGTLETLLDLKLEAMRGKEKVAVLDSITIESIRWAIRRMFSVAVVEVLFNVIT